MLDKIKATLENYRPHIADTNQSTKKAAVAVILRTAPGETLDSTEILFIKRAERDGDPWSGHMAFPGGHMEPDDSDLKESAIRETKEEIGLDLRDAQFLGPLDHQYANPRGRVLNMLIAPFLFQVNGNPPFVPNREVDEVVWASLNVLASNTLHDTESMLMSGKPTTFNGYRLNGGHFVWGLTYRILKNFLSATDSSWRPPKEIE